LRKLQGTE